jgi:hypothetical protein
MSFDYDHADYVIFNQLGQQRGPFNGKHATRFAATLWQEESGQAITVQVADTREEVAYLVPPGQWLFPDRRGPEGEHLGYQEW